MIFVFQTSQLSSPHPKATIDAFKDDLIRLKASRDQFTWHNEGTEEEALHFSLKDNNNFLMEIDNNNVSFR